MELGIFTFTELFPLFGQDLADYHELFAQKLDLLLKLREAERITWTGWHRPTIEDTGVYPRPVQDPIPVWIATGGTPASVVRAGRLGLPISLAIIGGTAERFRPLVTLYREAAEEAGHDSARLPVGISSHGFISATVDEAAESAFPPFAEVMTRIGSERGGPPTHERDSTPKEN